MPEPEVQQLPGGGCLTLYSFCTCPLYFAWVFLSYPMPSHFIGILSLGPCILLYFFRGSTPGNRRGSIWQEWNDSSKKCFHGCISSSSNKARRKVNPYHFHTFTSACFRDLNNCWMDDDPRILSDLFIVLDLIAGEKTP